jgi:transposase
VEVFVGIDWAEDHHDVCVQHSDGRVAAKGRVPDGIVGVGKIHELVDRARPDDDTLVEVIVGIETDRGLLVRALLAAGYVVTAVNPMSVDRYRDRHRVSGAKSDPGDAFVLAEMVRVDRALHPPVAGDSAEVEALKLVARAHQNAIWSRRRLANQLRSSLREYFPTILDLFDDVADRDCLAVLVEAPTPARARRLSLSKIAAALRRGGRKLNIDRQAAKIQTALREPALEQPESVADAYGTITTSLVRLLQVHTTEIAALEEALTEGFAKHPDAELLRSIPGLGIVTGARVLTEFGDDPNRYTDPKARKNYAGTSPLTVASGTRRIVRARHIKNRRLADALHWWAFNAITRSPGARALYDQRRAAGDTHSGALRVVANRLVGILHGILKTRTPYNEHTAWAHRTELAA